MIHKDLVARAGWRKSSFSGSGGAGSGNCVEVAPLADGTIALRNSNNPEAGVLYFTHTEMHAWIKSCKAGEFDDLLPCVAVNLECGFGEGGSRQACQPSELGV